MLFNSFAFMLAFLPISVMGYYFCIHHRWIMGSKVWLLLASFFFYAFWNVKYLPLLLGTIVVNFYIGQIMRVIPQARIGRKVLLIFGITFNIGLLAYYKYADFLIENINLLWSGHLRVLNIALPLAISFFTFQQIAYLVDVYKGLTPKYNLLNYALFISFFPQLIAGPIVSHDEMMPQFRKLRNLCKNYRHIFLGLVLFSIGLFKKVIIADAFSKYATLGFDEIDKLTLIGGWVTSLSYTLQIYFDFSGYCDMALGCAQFFNISLPVNFNSPYKAFNIQDFWKRWHITLSRFLKNYLYIPFGGNRHGELRACMNIILVFLIGGLWHGAAWTFVVWGMLHGLANAVFRLWKKTNIHLNRFFAWFILFNFINISWVFFRAKSFASAFKVLSAMVNIDSLKQLPAFRSRYYLEGFHAHSSLLFMIIIVILGCVCLPNSMHVLKWCRIYNKKQAVLFGCILAILLLFLFSKMVIVPYTEFIYFNF